MKKLSFGTFHPKENGGMRKASNIEKMDPLRFVIVQTARFSRKTSISTENISEKIKKGFGLFGIDLMKISGITRSF